MDDDDDSTFIDVEGLGVLSRAALKLHGFASMASVHDGHPGFVTDEWLGAIAAETTLPVAELETAGLWARRPGGYFILKDSAVSTVIGFREEQERRAAACRQRGFHVADGDAEDPDAWVVCRDCAVPMRRPDGGPVAQPNGGPLGPDPRTTGR